MYYDYGDYRLYFEKIVLRRIKYIKWSQSELEKNVYKIIKDKNYYIRRLIVNNLVFIKIRSLENLDMLKTSKFVPCKLPKLYFDKVSHYLVYDIETITVSEFVGIEVKDVLKWYLCCTQLIINNEIQECKQFSSVQEFISYLFNVINKLTSFKKLHKLCLMGYNSSRFDDIFVIPKIREKLIELDMFHKCNYFYGEKSGAIIFSSFYFRNVEVKLVDVCRYTGAPISLRNLAISLHLDFQKGFFPMNILIKNKIHEPIAQLLYKGFFLKSLFLTSFEYEEALTIWKEIGSPPILSVEKECIKYCLDDVKVTFEAWKKLEHMYFTYIKEGFGYTLQYLDNFHGAPSLMKAVCLNWCVSDLNQYWIYKNPESISYDFSIFSPIWVPCGKAYDVIVKTIYGGWVALYFKGVIQNNNLALVDIVSQYPNALTAPMPLGPAKECSIVKIQKIVNNFNLYNLNTIPIFFVKAKAIPREANGWISSLPLRTKNWLIWGYEEHEGYWNSIDMWYAHHIDNWDFIILENAYMYPYKGTIHNDFIQKLARMKREGKNEQNELKTNMAKIGMNACIGKFGEKSNTVNSVFVQTDKEQQQLIKEISFSPTKQLQCIIPERNFLEFRIKEHKVLTNNIPIMFASIMYAYSRISRQELARNCYNKRMHVTKQIDRKGYPLTLYGDTDSIVTSKEGIDNLLLNLPDVVSKDIKGYNTQLAKLEFSVEIEISNVQLGIFLNPKSYLLFSDRGPTKLRLKGHRLFDSSIHPCEQHQTVIADKCTYCVCSVSNLHRYICYHCLQLLWRYLCEDKIKNPAKKCIYSKFSYITPAHFLCALLGDTVKVNYPRLDRTLTAGRSSQSRYSIVSINRLVSFSSVSLSERYNTDYEPILYPLGSLQLQ